MRVCPNDKQWGGNPSNRSQSSSGSPPNRDAPREASSGTGGGTNNLYALIYSHGQEITRPKLSLV